MIAVIMHPLYPFLMMRLSNLLWHLQKIALEDFAQQMGLYGFLEGFEIVENTSVQKPLYYPKLFVLF